MNEIVTVSHGIGWLAGTLGGIAIAVLIIGIVGIVLAYTFRRVVDPNEVHIVQGCDVTRVYGRMSDAGKEGSEGLSYTSSGNSYYDWPAWWPKYGVQTAILPLSVFDQDLLDYDAYDVGKVPFVVDIKSFYRISDPLKAAERVKSMPELEAQLKDILRGAARTILAKEDIEDIMMERAKYGQKFTDEVEEQLREWGVCVVKSIELMDIRDSKDSRTVSNIMAKKESFIEMQSRQEVAENKKNAEIKEIGAGQERDIRDQEALELVGLRTALKDQNVGVANEQAQQVIKTQSKLTAMKEMDVQQVELVRAAEIQKEVQVVGAAQQKETDVIRAEGEKQQTILRADGAKQQVVLKSEGDLASAQNEAIGILKKGESVATSAKLLNLADVDPQIVLAQEIGENQGYQNYLVGIREIDKNEAVGIEQAKALQKADIKVIANTGDVTSGVSGAMDLFTSKGGTNISAMVEGVAQTPAGKALLGKFGIDVDKA